MFNTTKFSRVMQINPIHSFNLIRFRLERLKKFFSFFNSIRQDNISNSKFDTLIQIKSLIITES
ncbi:hypothetical protein BpHYR1_027566 [Brachionus plicatilis]|uniref:Uncharacterized protein n=1 Tax=Brachionus plicatilis TaxID=10195 RepID=A0A3M7RQD8_BRAPC|nr:hypothetical protein BpHYR1_027566 [Brachionus plicatilis]